MFLIIIPQIAYIVESQSCFPASLSVPNDAMFDASVQFLLNSHRCEKLWIPHDVLFQRLDAILIGALYISKTILEQHHKSVTGKQGR